MAERPTIRRRLVMAFVAYVVVVVLAIALLGLWYGRDVAAGAARDELELNVDRVVLALERAIDTRLTEAAGVDPATERPPLGSLRDAVTTVVTVARAQDLVVARFAPDGTQVELARTAPGGGAPVGATAAAAVEGLGDGLDLDVLARDGALVVDGGDRVLVARTVEVVDRERAVLGLGEDLVVVAGTTELGPLELGEFGPRLLVAALAALTLGTILAVVLANRLARPVQAAETAAHRIAGGDLSVRVDVPSGSHREGAALVDAVNRMAADLEDSRRRERDFLASVSHELKTPLTSIRGFGELLESGTLTDAEAVGDAGATIGREAGRLGALVEDLLSLARLDASRFSLHPAPTDLADVVVGQCATVEASADEAGIELVCPEPDACPAVVDAVRVGQVVRNLVQNAVDFATSSVRVDVETTDRLPDDHRVVEPSTSGPWGLVVVTDDGPGVGGDLDRIFERFETAGDRRGGRAGSGVGLAVVRELVDLMGGALGITSTGEGTRVWAAVPRDPGERDDGP